MKKHILIILLCSLSLQAAENSKPRIFSSAERQAFLDAKDHEGKTALMLAVKKGCPSGIVLTFLETGASVDVQDDEGNTALHEAMLAGRDDLVLMLASDFSVIAKNKKGLTPDDFAHNNKLKDALHLAKELLQHDTVNDNA